MAKFKIHHLIQSSFFQKYCKPLLHCIPTEIIGPIYRIYIRYSINNAVKIIQKIKVKENIAFPKGINLFGYVKSNIGIGQQSRLIANPLIKYHTKICCIDSSKSVKRDHENFLETDVLITQKPEYNCNLVAINVNSFAIIYGKRLEKDNFFSPRYNITYNAWEWSKYPTDWIPLSNKFDELWAMSEFVKQAAEKALNIPVLTMPFAVEFPTPPKLSRNHFGLSDHKFIFMFSYDFNSNIYRKNPLAVIKAFLLAFPKDQNLELIVKVNMVRNLPSHIKELKTLHSYTQNDKRIKIIDNVLTNDHMKSLINLCDSYISLHRSEGFGLGMAEAMKLGKPVIATNYSGNTDFTTPYTACVVDYKIIDVQPSESIYYEKGQIWADPYIEHAAEFMKKLYEDTTYYKKIAKAGKVFIDTHYNYEIIGERFIKRLKTIGVL